MRIERRYLAAAALALAVAALVGTAIAWLWPRPPSGILQANGQVRGTEVTVSAKNGGIVEVVAVREGAQVAKGDLVAQIGAADIEARLAQAKALAEAAEAQIARIDTAIEQARLGRR
ncbi:MAG: biotin/lipoyl-binding protein [Burkholderiales bacterium]